MENSLLPVQFPFPSDATSKDNHRQEEEEEDDEEEEVVTISYGHLLPQEKTQHHNNERKQRHCAGHNKTTLSTVTWLLLICVVVYLRESLHPMVSENDCLSMLSFLSNPPPYYDPATSALGSHPRRRLQANSTTTSSSSNNTWTPYPYTQFDIMVPVFDRDPNLRRFAQRLKPALAEYQRNSTNTLETFRLLVTRYTAEEKAHATKFQQELSQLSGLPTDQIVMVSAPAGTNFTRAHAVNLLLAAACHDPHCLVARIDVDMQLRAGFFYHAQQHTYAHHQAYFPIVWSAYQPVSLQLIQFHWDVPAYMRGGHNRTVLDPVYGAHAGHWREYGTGMWVLAGPDAASSQLRFNEQFKGWGGEDGDFHDRLKKSRLKIKRQHEPGLIHLWHPKLCTKGVTVFTDTQINECNWSRDGEKGSDLGRAYMEKWSAQHTPQPPLPKEQWPIWQA